LLVVAVALPVAVVVLEVIGHPQVQVVVEHLLRRLYF
jgi:hypothetical protein